MRTSVLFIIAMLFFIGCEEDPITTPTSPVVNVSFNAVFDGEPLVMFDEHDYGDASIKITVSEFYLNNFTLVNDQGEEINSNIVEFVDFTEENTSLSAAEAGINIGSLTVEPGTYTKIKFGIGVPEDINSMKPADFTSDNPLSKAGNYWSPWDSYVFMKHQGLITDASAGADDKGWLWHIGSDALYRDVELDINLVVTAEKDADLVIALDHKNLFADGTSSDGLFDILSSPENHQPVLNGAMQLMADNFQNAFENK